MRLHTLRPRPGARHRVKRLGIGESSGHGKTSGKGHKGQKARSGGSLRLGFEGGQMPLIRRLPKRGFNNAAFHKNYACVNLSDLSEFKAGSTIDERTLRESKLIRGNFYGIKILGDGELKHGLTIEADKFSTAAKEKIEKAGGTATVREARAPRAEPKEDVDLAAKPEESEAKPKKRSTTKSAAKPKAAKKKTARKK